jgi:hypothetical protein
MIEQTGKNVNFFAHYTYSGISVTGLIPTVSIFGVGFTGTPQGPYSGAATELGSGIYFYTYTANTPSDYVCMFHAIGRVDQPDIPSLWTVGHPWVQNIDATITSRYAAVSGVTPRPTYLIQGASYSGYCTVYAQLLRSDGKPLVDVPGWAKIITLPYSVDQSYYGNVVDDTGFKAYSNSSGIIQWDLVWGSIVSFRIPFIDLEKMVTIPVTGLIALTAL